MAKLSAKKAIHRTKSRKAMKNPLMGILKAGIRGEKSKKAGGLFMSSFPKI